MILGEVEGPLATVVYVRKEYRPAIGESEFVAAERRYIRRENIPIPQMYFSRNGKRFRSLGCSPITHPIESNASNIDEIIAELESTRVGERAGRAQDHYERNAMQKLRAKGFL